MTHKFNAAHKHKLDNPERRRLLPPEEILRKLGLHEGDIMADIGCGIGYFTLPAAKIVGAEGRVYALDILPEMLTEMNTKLVDEQLINVELVAVQEKNYVLPDKTVDYAFASLVVHEVDDLQSFLGEVSRMLKPAGQITIIEWKKQQSVMGPPMEHRIDSCELEKLVQQFGFQNIFVAAINAEMYAITAKLIK